MNQATDFSMPAYPQGTTAEPQNGSSQNLILQNTSYAINGVFSIADRRPLKDRTIIKGRVHPITGYEGSGGGGGGEIKSKKK
jgi:hypothetical protein